MRIQITDHPVGWIEEEVQAWLAKRVATRAPLPRRRLLAQATAAANLKINIERRVGFGDAIETLATMRAGHARGKSVILI